MKKQILAALALAVTMASQAQVKKSWDFLGSGLSDQTIANLDTDTSNWEKEGTDDNGNTTGWKEAKKHTGVFMANGEVIPELLGIELMNSGLSNSNNVIIRKDRLRLNRNSMKFKLPKLVNGQTITIVCQSANSTATNRGVKASYDYMKRIEGPEDNLIPGPSGLITNKWQIVTDETDSVDVEFTMITGGIDFRLIQIDEGDVPQVLKVALLTGEGGDPAVEAILKAREYTEVTAIDVNTIPTDYTEASVYAENLRDSYDAVVLSASVPADHTAALLVKQAIPYMPVLNLNSALYTAWGYGKPVSSSPFARVMNKDHGLFRGIADEDFITEGDITAIPFSAGATDAMMAVELGSFFEGDDMPAVSMEDENTPLIHTHNISHNGYIYLPSVADYSDAAVKVMQNAITLLASSKADITQAPSPIISREYKHQATLVTITPARVLPKTRIYYTTDGTPPTAFDPEYTGVITLTEPCTVRAIALAEGYQQSKASELVVKIKSQPKAPAISYAKEEGQSVITLTCEDADAEIWYNFANTTDTTKSSKYVEPIVIKMPATITAFSVDTLERGDEVWSEVAEKRILVKNPRVVIDVAAHFSAAKWDDVSNGSGLFSWGKSAASMYVPDTGEEQTVVDPDTGEQTTIWVNQDVVEGETRDEPGDDPQWTVTSKGQSVLWQNITAATDKIGTNEGGYYPSVAEDIDALFPVSSYDIQFYKIYAGETANATITSKVKYQAPLDVVTIANMQGGPLTVQVSPDGQEWTTVGDEIAKTGYSRMWKKYTNSYEGTDEVFVRVAQLSGDSGAKVFDIYVANAGEKSKALLDEINAEFAGIEDIRQDNTAAAAKGIYSLSGVRQSQLRRGLNIIVSANGTTRKVMK